MYPIIPSKTGDIVLNTKPPVGSYVGWVCIDGTQMGRVPKDRLGTETRRLNPKLKHMRKRKGRIDFRTNPSGKRK